MSAQSPNSAERRVELVSPFPAHAWPRVWTWLEPFRRRVLDDLSPPNRQAYVEQQLALSRLPNYRSWGVKRGGDLGGLIALLQPRGAGDPSAIVHLARAQAWPLRKQHGRDGRVPPASGAQLAAVVERAVKPDDTDGVIVWMRPWRMAEVAGVAASMNTDLSTAVGILLQAYFQGLGPDSQRLIQRARERARVQAGRKLDEPSLDARQQTLTQALATIAAVAQRYPAETFPVDARTAVHLDAVSDWINTLNRVRAQARSRPPAVDRSVPWGPSDQDFAVLARARRRYA